MVHTHRPNPPLPMRSHRVSILIAPLLRCERGVALAGLRAGSGAIGPASCPGPRRHPSVDFPHRARSASNGRFGYAGRFSREADATARLARIWLPVYCGAAT